MNAEIKALIQDSQLVLVGIGEEFYDFKGAKADAKYTQALARMESCNKTWLLPLLNYVYIRKNNSLVGDALKKLSQLLEGKNYFVVSVCANGFPESAGFKEERLVSPCGSVFKIQCANHCEGTIRRMTDLEFTDACTKLERGEIEAVSFGKCPTCGKEMSLNNVYTERYDENGYLPEWGVYTKWLQGTLNRKLCVLELGVNMTYPSVIRWPFEKIGFFNQKASFVRVNEKLYQLTEDLKDKGISIPKNAIDWLLEEDL